MLLRNILPAVKADSTAPHERAVLHLARRRGLLRSRDVAALGIPTVILTRLARAGSLSEPAVASIRWLVDPAVPIAHWPRCRCERRAA